MQRLALAFLEQWKDQSTRRPLVIRGARQVGKTWLVRTFGRQFQAFVELNCETDRTLGPLFSDNPPARVLDLLSLKLNVTLTPGTTLLFIDEIQAAPEIFARLRYFHEQLPELHVIAAGSLLEFVLENHEFSMPVGRIEYLHLGPATFSEFLRAVGRDKLADYLDEFTIDGGMPDTVHDECLSLFRAYLAVGGMPESITEYARESRFQDSDRVKQSILATYVDDFRKYGTRVNYDLVDLAFRSVPGLVSRKVKYSEISRDHRAKEVSTALHMLELARVCTLVHHSASRGIPLGADANPKVFKVLFLDVGLQCSASGLNMLDIQDLDSVALVNAGSVCEQFVGQHLLYREEPYVQPQLHYWSREKPTSNAEVDFVFSSGVHVVPVEVKAGKTGSLRSLHQFCTETGASFAVRFNADRPSLVQSSGGLPSGGTYRYRLLSLPCYLVEQCTRLVRETLQE